MIGERRVKKKRKKRRIKVRKENMNIKKLTQKTIGEHVKTSMCIKSALDVSYLWEDNMVIRAVIAGK